MIERLVELFEDEVGKISIHGIGLSDFKEGPAAKFLKLVDAGNPVGAHGFGFDLGIFATVALDFDNEIEGVIGAFAVVDFQQEIWDVATLI